MANLVLKNNTSGGKTSVTADNFVGNASSASKWLTARTLTLSGDASGSVSIDGSGNMTLSVTVADSSHNHAASNITSGTLAIARIPTITVAKGGTGATDAATARTNLGVPSTTGSGASGTWGIDINGKATYINLSLGNADVSRPVIFQDSNLYTDKLYACYHSSFSYNPVSGYLTVPKMSFGTSNVSGHLYLTGANANSSTSNTSQIVFGTASNNHVVISSNTNCLIINPSTSTTSGQIAMYTDKQSSFPNGIGMGPLSASTGTFSGAVSASSVSAAAHYGCLFLQNLGYTCYGTADPNSAGLDKVEGRVYFKI